MLSLVFFYNMFLFGWLVFGFAFGFHEVILGAVVSLVKFLEDFALGSDI